MRLLTFLERRIGWLAIPNLGLILAVVQGVAFVISQARPELVRMLTLDPAKIVAGEWWRAFTFMFIPPDTWLIFLIFVLYLLYLMANALEQTWGTFRLNVYLFIAWVATLGASFAAWSAGMHGAPMSNEYVMSSIFLAFAFLYPDFTLLLMFIFPVKIKWLALLTWILYGFQFVEGDAMDRAAIAAAVLNFFVFFGADMVRMIRNRGKRAQNKFKQMQNAPDPEESFHRCTVCGRTDKTNPELEFRYCPQCGGKGYCQDHIMTHQHVR